MDRASLFYYATPARAARKIVSLRLREASFSPPAVSDD